MSTTVVVKIRDGQVQDIITNGLDVNVIIADYGQSIPGIDPHGEPCYITKDIATEEPKEVYEFEEIIEHQKLVMRI